YHAIMGYDRCARVHPSDMAPALIVLKATAILAGTQGERQMPVHEFYENAKGLAENILEPGELLKEIIVPNPHEKILQLFLKSRIRHASDFALVSAAAAARISDAICEDISIALGGVAPIPYRSTEVEEIIRGKRLSEKLISQAAAVSVEKARPLPNNRYKIDLTKALIRRALLSLWQQAEGASLQ
ncbi:MAG: FAD binding domain-containing protein, partial [Deltaproteobacteria bacterium]|nr:FAD binding domain-containing protein [Deltaproteobacteria bacterium]